MRAWLAAGLLATGLLAAGLLAACGGTTASPAPAAHAPATPQVARQEPAQPAPRVPEAARKADRSEVTAAVQVIAVQEDAYHMDMGRFFGTGGEAEPRAPGDPIWQSLHAKLPQPGTCRYAVVAGIGAPTGAIGQRLEREKTLGTGNWFYVVATCPDGAGFVRRHDSLDLTDLAP